MTDAAEERSVAISSGIYERIEGRVQESEFENVEDYVEFVLLELLNQLEGTGTDVEAQDQEIQDRLRELGYLE